MSSVVNASYCSGTLTRWFATQFIVIIFDRYFSEKIQPNIMLPTGEWFTGFNRMRIMRVGADLTFKPTTFGRTVDFVVCSETNGGKCSTSQKYTSESFNYNVFSFQFPKI